jgi:cytidylate kinase
MGSRPPFIVTIDGPAGAGKSTAARGLAIKLGFAFLDTGAIYRAVALTARRRGIDWSHGAALGVLAEGLDIRFESRAPSPEGASALPRNCLLVDGVDCTDAIRTQEISEGASRVSAHPSVRAALLGLQRTIATLGPIVAEGRDTGTVVFPHAQAKFFLTATSAERARRRAAELRAAGQPADVATIEGEILRRDERDSTREAAPLRKAEDAIEIDTGGLTPEQVIDELAALTRARGG